ncbi:NAD(P)H-quinone oxidoreductase [Sphingorhabdus soli]|uniref:NAD(P)H-quinone oxidoreductase n=1 Tax=Flavisphingopyxis soli TaxID=2601267 RepID=A0A5C6UKW8_9SPHN|nr:NAD(P)H-quinone oxidoreductase [Sphingorhabdus soli]TXC73733.1 NAD(P)H-quinone oxidoreductase [Sphingorhabdus soli]
MTSTAETMTVIAIREAGDPDVLVPETLPVPTPGAGEVLVRVAASGVNRPDVLQRRGMYPPPAGASPIPGLEIAGEVVALGEGVDASMAGARVCGLVAGGGYAEYCLVPAAQCLVVPDGLSMIEAAALPETLFTVWSNLFQRGGAKAGDTVLVHGGTSGIGTMAIALCNAMDIAIIVTCGSAEKCAAALEAGADHAINYKTEDFVEAVTEATEGQGVAVVLDMIGGDYVPRNLACLAEDGRHVSIAFQRGMTAEIGIVDIMRRRLTLTGSTLRPRGADFKAALASDIREHVWPLVAAGKVRPVIDRSFPLSKANAAHSRMEAGDHVGKIVLVI